MAWGLKTIRLGLAHKPLLKIAALTANLNEGPEKRGAVSGDEPLRKEELSK